MVMKTPSVSGSFLLLTISAKQNPVMVVSMILCECGEIVNGATFKDYIKTSANPSTSTIGHQKCGLIFDFYDDKVPKKYSSRKELKSLAVRFAEKNDLDQNYLGKFLVEVDRLKSAGKLSDRDILLTAYQRLENVSDITARF